MTWDLIDRHGFNRNVYAPWHTGGNNLAIQLVMDGLKMQGCFPGFVVARDAIIAADEALTDGDNACTLWASFARRGLGFSATQGLSFLRNDNSEAFDTHPDCRKGFTSGISPGPALNRVRAGDNVALRFKADRPRGHRDVLASNSPFSRRVDCQTLKTKGPGPYITPRPLPEPTRTPGWSRLTYERHGDRYMYPWKTLREWEGTCREVVVTRADGVQHRAYFRFTPDAPPEETPVLERWQARYNGHGDGQDFAQDAVMSADGKRVYVTGQSLGETTAFDYATIAYDAASGEQLWVARYNGPPGDGHDVAWTLKLSPDGSRLFVTGQSVTSETSSTDYATVAYDTATGRELWAAREASPDEWSLDIAYAIDVSRDGTRVFVTGQMLAGASSLDYATAAYDAATGERLWLTRYNGPFPFGNASDIASGVAVSPDGSRVFVTGESSGVSSGQDITTVAYEAETGRELWVGRYNGPANFNDEAAGLAVSPDGSRVFVTGESPGAGPFEPDYATVAYDAADGSERWVARYDGSGHGADIAKAMAVSPDGRRVFVTGSSWAGERTSYDYATVSYDAADGAQQWVSTYNGFANGIESPWALTVSPDGSKVVVTGQNLDVGTDLPDYATASYDAADGREQWIARYDGPALGADIPRAAAVSPDGRRVVVSGQSEGLETRDDYATVAYDVNGPLAQTGGSAARSGEEAYEGR
jgi:DNA-binding beta-propeller fold protein YncE